jgi:hypothetical protein
MRASHAHLDAVLLSTNKAPGQMPAQPLFALLVARHRRRLWHAITVVMA